VQGLIQFIRTLGAARLAAMGAVTLALIGFFTFVILRVTAVPLVTLYTDLSFEDSSAIVKDLERQAIPFQIKNDGAIIMVPQDKVARLRMKLAEGGLPKGGGIGYEIFDKSEALGTTSFVQNINHLRALEGELARTIRSLDRVVTARVHLVIPERPLFSRDKAEPSASIVVKARGTLEMQQVRAMRQLVASAVNGLRPQRVSIVDESGRLLADGTADDGVTVAGAGGDERQLALERRLREQIEGIVTSVVGAGHARVNVNADFDFNRITQTSDRYDPEGRVLRSSQTREESSSNGDSSQAPVSVGNELPGANAQNQNQQNPAQANREQSKKSEEIVNYEISRTTKTEVVEGGRVNKISVAVLVDGIYNKNDKGEATYQERPKEQLDRIAALVRSAVGFDSKRGDQVEVVNLQFADVPAQIINEPAGLISFLTFTKDDIVRGVELLVMLLLGIVVVLLVVRPLVRRIITPDEAALAARPSEAISVVETAQIAPQGTMIALPGASNSLVDATSKTARRIDIAQVKGQVHAQSVQKVGELADQNPNEAVSIIRQWLNEPEPA
jgi:flagellar M-ring protein FliF